jgi:hypothetical protein
MTKHEREQIAGRFTIASYKPLVIACLGSLWADSLSPAQLQYILRFFMVPDGASYKITHERPDFLKTNRHFNDYIIFEIDHPSAQR